MNQLFLDGNFFGDPGQTKAGELGLWLGITLFIAIAIFGFGLSKERDGMKPWVKWIAFIPVVFALIETLPFFSFAQGRFENEMGLIGGSSKVMYLAAPAIPIVVGIALAVIGTVGGRIMRNDTRF